jgi:hypothetical protein
MPRLRHRGDKIDGDLPGGIDRANYHIVGVKDAAHRLGVSETLIRVMVAKARVGLAVT